MLGVCGLVLGTLGAIVFGVFLSLPALIAGIVGVVMSINVKKETNGQKGSGAMVVGILAIVFASIFTVGCAACGSGSAGYGCYGCAGASCKAQNDINNTFGDFELDDWY